MHINRMLHSRVLTLTILCCILVWRLLSSTNTSAVGAAPASLTPAPPPDAAALVQARKPLQSFIDAYNRHDIAGVFSTMAFSHRPFMYNDCDYLPAGNTELQTATQVRTWLQARFAEGDQLSNVTFHQLPKYPIEIGFSASRTNDLIRARGLLSVELQTKMVLTTNLSAIWRFQLDNCSSTASMPLPSAHVLNRVVARAFLDAYNGGDVPRVLDLVSSRITYTDCNVRNHHLVVRSGKRAVSRQLHSAFGLHDRITGAHVVTNTSRMITLQIVRNSDRLIRMGMTNVRGRVEIVVSGRPTHITKVRIDSLPCG